MISATSLIAVLMQVISIVFANPNIPQETKDQVFQQITQAIQAENGTSGTTSGTSSGTTSGTTQTTLGGTVTTTPVEPVTPVTPVVVVSQACKDETANLKEKEYNVNALIKNRDEQIRNVDIFEGHYAPEYVAKRKQEITDTFTPMILKAQEIVTVYQGKVTGVCN